jgi:hypothetical protein
MLGTPLTFVRTTAEMTGPGLYLTNYESVREGKIDVDGLTAVGLDEAAILRGFGGTKTFREFMAKLAGDDRESRHPHRGHPVPLRRHGDAIAERLHRDRSLRGVPRDHGRRRGEDPLLQARL